jgi:hypothetical protein
MNKTTHQDFILDFEVVSYDFSKAGIHPKKMTETLHHALCAMMQFPVIFFLMDTSIHKQKNKFIP